MSKILQYLAVAICLIIVGMIARDGCGEKCPEVIDSSDTVFVKGDSFPHTVYDSTPVPYKVVEHTWDTVTLPIDTVAILSDYLAARYYAGTIDSDSSCALSYYIKVSQNRIDSLKLTAQNNRRTAVIINTSIVTPPDKFRIYAGAFYNSNAGVSASLEKNRWLYSLGIDTEKKPMFGISYRIR